MSAAGSGSELLPNVIAEDEAVEVTQQEPTTGASSTRELALTRTGRLNLRGRSPPLPVSAAAEAGGSSSQAHVQVPEVICLDSPPAPARTSHSHAPQTGRKVRRLNDSTPVIVVDDDDASPAGGSNASASGAPVASASRFAPETGGSASDQRDDSSITPIVPRRRHTSRVHSGSSRPRSARPSSTSPEIVIDESPPRDSAARTSARSMPSFANLGQRRILQSSSASRSGRFHRAVRTSGNTAGASRTSSGRTTSTRNRIFDVVLEYGGPAATTEDRSATARRSAPPSQNQVNLALNQIITRPGALQLLRRNAGGVRRVELHFIGDALPDYETLVRLDEQNLRERFAAPKKVIEKLPEVVATEKDEEITCVICMCDVKKDEVLRELPCKHKFHKGCIDKWLTYNGCCPVDKKRVSPPNPVNHSARSSAGPSSRETGLSFSADSVLFGGSNGFSAARQVFRARRTNSSRSNDVSRSRPAEQS